ncbi:hypothetical protein GQX74_005400 [Glossina fuscipes]|nr:hypothetical protein GQX74_005400 [Glossina fuscipes]
MQDTEFGSFIQRLCLPFMFMCFCCCCCCCYKQHFLLSLSFLRKLPFIAETKHLVLICCCCCQRFENPRFRSFRWTRTWT